MKKTFLKFLPVVAAVLLATSCGKDDNSAVVDNIATPDPVQEVLKPVAKTITITGKVNLSLSKVASDDGVNLSFEGREEFTIFNYNGDNCGKLTIQDDKATYKAEFYADKIKEGDFYATLGNRPTADWSKVSGYATLNEALKDAYYEILFTVTKGSDDAYSIGDVEATIECALVKALSSKDITLGHVTAGNFYIVPLGAEISNKVEHAEAGKIYRVGGNDALSGTFSVSEGKTVSFSKGNLMYRPGVGYFFADTQWSYIGNAEGNTSETEGTRDLFGWGMWLSGETPMNSSTDESDYLPTVRTSGEFPGFSAIGSDWYTLSIAEWKYLLNCEDYTNETREKKNGIGTITIEGGKTIFGLIIVPDDYNDPADVTQNFVWGETNTTYSASDWSKMESAGAVFLPAAGNREGSSVSEASQGLYWSSSADGDAGHVGFANFQEGRIAVDIDGVRRFGLSVRLVRSL